MGLYDEPLVNNYAGQQMVNDQMLARARAGMVNPIQAPVPQAVPSPRAYDSFGPASAPVNYNIKPLEQRSYKVGSMSYTPSNKDVQSNFSQQVARQTAFARAGEMVANGGRTNDQAADEARGIYSWNRSQKRSFLDEMKSSTADAMNSFLNNKVYDGGLQ